MMSDEEPTTKKTPYQIIRLVILSLPYSNSGQVASILCQQFGFKQYTLEFKDKPKDVSAKKYLRELLYQQFSQTARALILLQDCSSELLKQLKKRNFLNVMFIDSTFKVRLQNYLLSRKSQEGTSTLVDQNQIQTYTKLTAVDHVMESEEKAMTKLQECMSYVKVRILDTGKQGELKQQIMSKSKEIMRPFRPTWDQYFMKMADIARRRSNCMKTSVGAVIVNSKNRVVSTGYNGTPKGLQSCFNAGCYRCNSNSSTQLDQCLCLHAQQSAIIEVGIGKTQGCKLYTTYYPCFSCAKVMKQAGIKKLFYMDDYEKVDSGKPFIQQNFAQEDVVQISVDDLYY